MKKYFLILLLLFVSALTQAQIYSSVPGLKITNEPVQASDTTEVEILSRVISGVNTGKVYVLPYSKLAIPRSTSDLTNNGEDGINSYVVSVDDISDLESYNGDSPVILVKDSLRGGIFNYFPSGLTVDDGVIFEATGIGSGHWKRWFYGDVIPEWFGAIGDGVNDDSTSLQAAADYCEDNSKDLALNSPIYRIGTIVNISGSINIKGNGWPVIKNDDGVGMFNVTGDNVVIEGLITKTDNYVDDVAQIYLKGKNCTVRGNYFEGQSWASVDIDSTATYTVFENNKVKDFEFGIYCRSTIGLKVLNNDFTGGFPKPSESLGIVGDGVKLSSPVDLVSEGNDRTIISGNNFTDMVRDGIDFFTGAENVIISNNHFTRIGVLPLDIKTIYRDAAESGTSVAGIRQDKEILIEGNFFDSSGYNNMTSGYSWISIVGSDETAGQTHGLADNPLKITVNNNHFKNSTIYGFWLERVSKISFTNNEITAPQNSTSHHCFWIQAMCDDIKIDNNKVYDLNSAFIRSAVSTNTNIQVTNNKGIGKAGNTQTMVFLDGTFNISGNTFENGNNIIFSSSASKSIISNNIIRNAVGNAIDVRGSASRVSIEGNKIYDSAFGIRFASTMTNCSVVNNSCYNVTTPYLSLTSIGVNSIVYGNTSDVASATFELNNDIVLNSHKVTGLSNGTAASDAVNKSQLDLKANLASPALTGTPTAPTATAGTNTTQIATTAFVTNGLSGKAGLADANTFTAVNTFNQSPIIPDADSNNEAVSYGQVLSAKSTGVDYGGEVTDLGSGVVRIAAGKGFILDDTDPTTPDPKPVTWSQTDIDLSATDDRYWIYVDDTGTVTSTTTEMKHEDYRTKIVLERVVIRSGVVSGQVSIGMPVYNPIAQSWDLFRALGIIKRGLDLSTGSNNYNITIDAGEIYQAGISRNTNQLNPHEIDFTIQSDASFIHIDQNNNQVGVETNIIDYANYDLSGTITAIPGANARAGIWTVFMFPNGNIRLLYPQQYYNNVTEAFVDLPNYSPVYSSNLNEAAKLGYIIISKDAATIYNPITTNRFGGLDGGTAFNAPAILTGSTSIDFASTAAGESLEATFTVNGAEDGDVVCLGVPSSAVLANTCYTARVSAANTVAIRFNNYSSSSADPATGTFKVKILK